LSEDPYKVLGLSRQASQDDIQKAYRKLAKKHHPDLNPGDRAAEEKFKQVSQAYDLLGDEEKRRRFDRGEIDAQGQERPEHRFYREYADAGADHPYASRAGFEDFADADIFSQFFRRGGGGERFRNVRMRGADVAYHLRVDFLDAVRGARRTLTLPDGSSMEISIPAGVEDGEVLRVRGKGSPGLNGGEAGDALIELEIAEHPVFRREGQDIHVELPITLDEAVLGGKVEVPTPMGPVTMTIPARADSGRTLRLRGKGVQGRAKGDELVHLKVVLPERIDPELESFMRRWREQHRYDPRKPMKGAA
jgi:DnaJ-class molecular chaperone